MFLERTFDRPGSMPPGGAQPPSQHAPPAHAALGDAACRALFDGCMDAVMLTGPDATVLRANALAVDLFGYAPQQLRAPGRLHSLFAPEDPKLEALVQQCRRGGQADGVVTAVRADRSLFTARVSVRRYAVDGDVPRAMIVVREVGEGPALNAHCAEVDPIGCMRDSARQIRAANAEQRRFAHALAHDLRTPIDAITGFGKVLERELGDEPPGRSRHYLQRIRAAGQQLDEYVQALLTLKSLTQAPLRPAQVDLSAIARAVLARLQLAEPHRALTSRVEDGLQAQGDPRLLKIVLENLLGNAWKFSARRRVCEISFTAAADAHGRTVYEVRDNGAGFEMAYADKLFGDFQRLHSQSEFPGIGIGLANVRRIVLRHGGRAWAESAQDQGAVFFFTLAGAAQDAAPDPAGEGAACDLCSDSEPDGVITLPAAQCLGL